VTIITDAVRMKRARAMERADPADLAALDALKVAVASTLPDSAALIAAIQRQAAIRSRLTEIDKERVPLIGITRNSIMADPAARHSHHDAWAPETVQARADLAKLDTEAGSLLAQLRPALAAKAAAQHTHDGDRARWGKSILIEHRPAALARFAPARRDAVRFGELLALRRKTHISIASTSTYAAADARVRSAGDQLDALDVLAGDLGGVIPVLEDTWQAPPLPGLSQELAAHIDRLKAANDAFQASRAAEIARNCVLEAEPRMPSRDSMLAAIQADATRAQALRDYLREELAKVHAPWRAKVSRMLATAVVEVEADLRASYSAALVGLQMVELLHRMAFEHSLIWARKYPSGAPGLHATRSLLLLLESGAPMSPNSTTTASTS